MVELRAVSLPGVPPTALTSRRRSRLAVTAMSLSGPHVRLVTRSRATTADAAGGGSQRATGQSAKAFPPAEGKRRGVKTKWVAPMQCSPRSQRRAAEAMPPPPPPPPRPASDPAP
eukprot:304649-Prymnesium_polylepis.1